MKYKTNILMYVWATMLLIGSVIQSPAQEFTTVSFADLRPGSVVKGIYLLEAGESSGFYLKEQTDGTLTSATLDAADEHFYFWVTENLNDKSFQLHSAATEGRVVLINEDGSAVLTDDLSNSATHLMFRMDSEGPLRDLTETGTVAIGSIITRAIDGYSGSEVCNCHVLSLTDKDLVYFRKRDISRGEFKHVNFSKTNADSPATVVQSANSTTVELSGDTETQNLVSSMFHVNGFGINDFQVTVYPGTEATIGLLEYTQHQFTARVYDRARPKIGLKIANDEISLLYLSGDQELLFQTSLHINAEVETNFMMNQPIQFGFEDQHNFAAIQNGDTIRMKVSMPADLFLNRSVTQTARMLVSLDAGKMDVAYNTGNGLINSQSDRGGDNGSDFISTDPYLPYYKGHSFVNGFDWHQSKWKVRYKENGDQEEDAFSPFYTRDPAKSSISVMLDESGKTYLGGEDYMPTEGWELVKANLGFNADGSVRNEAPAHPYAIFYDRVGATLRVFVFTKNEDIANQLTVSLGVHGGIPGFQTDTSYTPLLWGSLQQFSTLNTTRSGSYSKTIPFISSFGREWFFYDFVMEYDPCSEFFESSIELKVSKTAVGDLNLVGRLEGGSIPADTPGYSDWINERDNFLMGVMDTDYGALENRLGDISFNQIDKFGLMEFADEVNGKLEGRPITEAEKMIAKMEMEAQMLEADQEEEAVKEKAEGQIWEGALGVLEGGAALLAPDKVGDAIGIVKGLIDIGSGVSTLMEDQEELPSRKMAYAKKLYYESLGDKQPDQALTLAVPPPRPHVVFGELALKGKLTIETDLMKEEYISTPGARYSDNEHSPEWGVNGTRGSAPLYNKPMGRFALLKQAEFGVTIAYDSDRDIYRAYLKTKQKPYFAVNDASHGKIADVFLLALNVQTSSGPMSPTKNSESRTGRSYNNFFAFDQAGALPGDMDITDLINWEIINTNIENLPDKSDDVVAALVKDWISISYEVWSMTLTRLEARSLERIMSSSSQYFSGNTEFLVEEFPGKNTSAGFASRARELADVHFADYVFEDHEVFGDNYQISNRQENFADVMFAFCEELNNGFAPDTTTEVFVSVRDQEYAEPGKPLQGIKLYPNPTHDLVNFELAGSVEGNISIILFDFLGKALIQTDAYSNGFETVSGRVDVSTLPDGLYILQMTLPSGEMFSERIFKE